MFHRVDDWRALDGPRYFALALRLSAYRGVLRARVEQIQLDEQKGRGDYSSAAPAGARDGQVTHVSEEVALAQLGDWVEHGQG